MQKGDETVLNMRSCEIRAPSATKISFFSGCCNSMNYSVVTGICWDPLQGKGEPRSPCILEKWGYVHGGKIVVFGPPFRDGHREIRKRLQRLLGWDVSGVSWVPQRCSDIPDGITWDLDIIHVYMDALISISSKTGERVQNLTLFFKLPFDNQSVVSPNKCEVEGGTGVLLPRDHPWGHWTRRGKRSRYSRLCNADHNQGFWSSSVAGLRPLPSLSSGGWMPACALDLLRRNSCNLALMNAPWEGCSELKSTLFKTTLLKHPSPPATLRLWWMHRFMLLG